MADDGYGDGDASYFYDDDDYLYVEDDYAIADELAETQVPSPGYSGTNAELDLVNYEYDIYEYFGELEYGQDEYWDSDTGHGLSAQTRERGGGKRKRDDTVLPTAKKRKVSEQQNARGERSELEADNVVYKSFQARVPPMPPMPQERTSFALLPDWKERFLQEVDRSPAKKAMPADMRRAAEAHDGEETPLEAQKMHEDSDDEEGWEDDEDGDEDGDEDMQDALAGLDPEMLKAVLKQKLSETGLNNMDEAALEQAIAKMLSGSSDDAAGDLANLLLGQASEDGDTAVSGWLSGQGVQLDAQDDDACVATEELPDVLGQAGVAQTSPSDSVVGNASGKRSGPIKNKSSLLKREHSAEPNKAAAEAAQSACETPLITTEADKKRKAAALEDQDEKQPAKRWHASRKTS